MIRAVKAVKWDVTVSGITGDLSRFGGPPHSSDSTRPRTVPSVPVYTALLASSLCPLLCEHHPRGGRGQVHSGGAFPEPVFPSSCWNFQRALGPQTLDVCPSSTPRRRRANLSTPGEVPGNSSISLLSRRLQETETQAPPLWRGLAKPRSGARPGLEG